MSQTVWLLNHGSHHGDHYYIYATEELAEEQAARLLAYGLQDRADMIPLPEDEEAERNKEVEEALELYKAGSYSEMVGFYHNSSLSSTMDLWVNIEAETVQQVTFDPFPKDWTGVR